MYMRCNQRKGPLSHKGEAKAQISMQIHSLIGALIGALITSIIAPDKFFFFQT